MLRMTKLLFEVLVRALALVAIFFWRISLCSNNSRFWRDAVRELNSLMLIDCMG